MEIQSISLYTLDVKGGKILEINDLVESGIKTLDRCSSGDFVRHVIMPDIRKRFSNKDVVYINPIKDITEVIYDVLDKKPKGWDGIVISGFSRGGTGYYAIKMNEESNATIANATYEDIAIYANKAIFGDIANKCKLRSAPTSKHYEIHRNSGHTSSLSNRIREDFPGAGHLVIKPIDEYKGSGVVMVPKSGIKRELDYLFNELPHTKHTTDRYGDDGFSEKYWMDEHPNIFQIQEFVEDEPTTHAGKMWDGTRRYVLATIIEKDDDGILHASTKAYGGYVKLPRSSISDDKKINHENRISYSSSHNTVEWLTRIFGFAEKGSGEQIVLTNEEVQEETAQIVTDMNTMYKYLRTMDLQEYISSLKTSQNPADQKFAESAGNYLTV